MEIIYEKRTLSNGLDVIVREDHSCPIVAINLWYHVGSKDEHPGRTGFAHLFEHLMFEGSAHHNGSYFYPLQESGGTLNGSTSTDRTNYWEVIPTNAFDRALWMESDRMGFLLPALTQEKFETQRDVVLNERRQNYENRPYGLVPVVLMGALFLPRHPYHWLTIGDPDDLQAATLDEVRTFFENYYHPANASLAIVGDINIEKAFEQASQYFEEIPAGSKPESLELPITKETTEQRLLLEDRVELPRLYLSWRSPALLAPGDAELDLLGAILAGGKSSRLYRQLVLDRRIATDVSAWQDSHELAGTFNIVCTAAPGHELAELENVIFNELDNLKNVGPTSDEVERNRTMFEADFIYRLQTIGGFGGQSDQLNAYNIFVGDPGYFKSDLSRYLEADSENIKLAAKTYLSQECRVALSVVPRGRSQELALPGSISVHPK